MNRFKHSRQFVVVALWLGLAVLADTPAMAIGAQEDTFPSMTIGTQTYTNVTVTTKAKTYIMIMHSAGMANFKVSELSPELREQLGYAQSDKPKTTASGAAAVWAREKMAAINATNVEATKQQLQENGREKWAQILGRIHSFDRKAFGALYGAILVVYFMFCLCLMKICQKAGYEPGILIWLPVVQVIPLLHAAKMSLLWLLGIPCGVTQIVWCFKIAKARGKSALTGVCLLFPITNLIALLYLAFSDGVPVDEEKKDRVQVMSLEVA